MRVVAVTVAGALPSDFDLPVPPAHAVLFGPHPLRGLSDTLRNPCHFGQSVAFVINLRYLGDIRRPCWLLELCVIVGNREPQVQWMHNPAASAKVGDRILQR